MKNIIGIKTEEITKICFCVLLLRSFIALLSPIAEYCIVNIVTALENELKGIDMMVKYAIIDPIVPYCSGPSIRPAMK